MLSWWRTRRRRKLVSQPFPDSWEAALDRNFAYYRWLSDAERDKLRRDARIFIAEKYWEGCQGLEITDEIRITIAAQACLLVLGFQDEFFDRLRTILVYPAGYLVNDRRQGPGGLITESTNMRLGEAWHQGPVILSWPDVLKGGRIPNDGKNVVFHEFAHVLDMQDHGVDGTPPLESAEQYETWQQVMTAEYDSLVMNSSMGRATLLDSYGAQNEAEFFAVATECFFEKAEDMADEQPRLYRLLKDFYKQDPATRTGWKR